MGQSDFTFRNGIPWCVTPCPIVTVILNNACWGISNHGQETIRGADNDLITKLNPTAYEIVAQGFGAHGELVERLEDLGPAVQRAFEAGVPAVVNVRVSLSVVHPITIAMHGEVQSEDEVVIPYYQNEGTSSIQARRGVKIFCRTTG